MKKAMAVLAMTLVLSLTACTDESTAANDARRAADDLFAGRSYEEMLRDGRVTDWDSQWNTGTTDHYGSTRNTDGATKDNSSPNGTIWPSSEGTTGANGTDPMD